jgi:hypothetical protein
MMAIEVNWVEQYMLLYISTLQQVQSLFIKYGSSFCESATGIFHAFISQAWQNNSVDVPIFRDWLVRCMRGRSKLHRVNAQKKWEENAPEELVTVAKR